MSHSMFALAEGRFALDDTMVSFFPHEVPPDASDNLKAVKVRDLLTMRAGHARPESSVEWRQTSKNWVRDYLRMPVAHQPGTHFAYSGLHSHMLAAILQKATGQAVEYYLRPRLFDPLGIDGFSWDVDPQGITIGGNRLSLKLEDFAKFGLFCHQRGRWNGEQLLPEKWVVEATSAQVNDVLPPAAALFNLDPESQPRLSYGYQFWLDPQGSYRASGMFGQHAIVVPQHDLVVAVSAATDLLGADETLRILFKELVPALEPAPAPFTSKDMDRLSKRLGELRVVPEVRASEPSPVAATISGKWYRADPNEDGIEALKFDFCDAHCIVTVRDGRGDHHVLVGLKGWIESKTTITSWRVHRGYDPSIMAVLASGAWGHPSDFVMTWCFLEFAFRDTVRCRFDADTVAFDRSVNLNMGSTQRPTVTARSDRET